VDEAYVEVAGLVFGATLGIGLGYARFTHRAPGDG
jgi:ribosome-binding ATPase YchF (GTP1/OBG family)